jgi:hypothetical protein
MQWADVPHCTLLVRKLSLERGCDAKHLQIRDWQGHVGCYKDRIVVFERRYNSRMAETLLGIVRSYRDRYAWLQNVP